MKGVWIAVIEATLRRMIAAYEGKRVQDQGLRPQGFLITQTLSVHQILVPKYLWYLALLRLNDTLDCWAKRCIIYLEHKIIHLSRLTA